MARSFFITRASANSEDPTALEFWPPKGSDELHEALKEAFPFETNLAARMRAAVIEFLLQEQQAEQFVAISPEYLPSPQSSFVSTMPSPATASSQTQQDVSQSRRQSAGQPSQQELMDVWSLPNKPQAKIHTRRTMTTEEKKAYKQKRIVGACIDCKRRRRKCEHNPSVAGTNPVPQKVGKHKKRAPVTTSTTTAPASKPEATLDFSWSGSAFAFGNDLASMAIPVDSEMPSFELDTTDFDFTPDLNTDWQLFPDLPTTTTHVDMSPSCSLDHTIFDTSIFAPQASMRQSRVSTGLGNVGVLDQDLLSQDILSTKVFDTGVVGTGTTHNAPITPVTPVSLSPISPTQSASGLLDRRDYNKHYDSSSSHLTTSAKLPTYSAGANIEQLRVNMGESNYTSLTPTSPSTLSPSQSVNWHFGLPRPNNDIGTTIVSASDIAVANLFQPVGVNANEHGVPGGSKATSRHNQETLAFKETLLLNEPHNQSPISRTSTTHAQAEHSLVFVPPLQTNGMPLAASPTRTSAPSQRTQSRSSRPSPSTFTSLASSTMSRPSSHIHQGLPSDGESNHIHAQTQHTSEKQLEGVLRPAVPNTRGRNETSSSQQAKDVSLSQVREKCVASGQDSTSRNDWFLAQAPISVTLYAIHCATARSSDGLAFIASLLISVVVVLSLLKEFNGSAKGRSSMLNMASWAMRGNLSQLRSTVVSYRQSSKSTTYERPLSSHLGFSRASVMV